MPFPDLPSGPRRPPTGVPRWLWPPPGAVVRSLTVEEELEPEREQACYRLVRGEPPGLEHLRALIWLIDDHPAEDAPSGVLFIGRVELEIARTVLPAGRIGHAYALDRGPLGAPGASAARGILRRYAVHRLRGG